jgi:membrane-bound lytic murein transglycosylase D
MARKAHLAALTFAGAIALAGCASSTRNAQVHPAASLRASSGPFASLPLERKFPEVDLSAVRPGIDVLIDKVKAAYQAGEQNYRLGRMQEARRDFDQAVNLMLGSGLEFKADPRLEPLMDRIIDTVHAYEETARKEGQGEAFAAPEQESTPIEEIGELSNLPPASPELRARIAPELLTVSHDLPLTLNDQVLSYLSFFMTPRGRAIVQNGLRREGRYSQMIKNTLHKEGLPKDLVYLAQAESGFEPRAVSRAGARGLWQFMPLRAREYGLTINRQVDERMDPVESTLAAAQHLRDLYALFGDWYLAMAAYNAGPLTVARAIERTGYADFWKLAGMNALPPETKGYVPIILALALIGKDPELYGIHMQPDPPLRVDRFEPGHPLDLRLAADATGTTAEELKALNPELIALVTPNDPDFPLNLPKGTAARLRSELDTIPPDKWVGWRLHRVKAGETLAAVAHAFHMRPASLAEANDIQAGDELAPGERLLVPAPQPRARLVRYRVRRGDTYGSVAARFGVTTSELQRWNRLRGSWLPRGRLLRIYLEGATYPAGRERAGHYVRTGTRETTRETYHRVRPGETLWSIARAYHTSVPALRAANPELAHEPLKAGQLLYIHDKE